MAQKPSFLKRITTASTVAFAAAAIVGTGSTAFGAAVNSVSLNDPSALATAADWQQGAANAAPAVGAGNTIFLGGAHNLNFNAAIGNLGTLNLYGNDGKTVTVTKANQLINVISTVDGAAIAAVTAANNDVAIGQGAVGVNAKIAFNINFAGIMEFGNANAGILTALGNITLSDNAAVMKISANDQHIQQIEGNAVGDGIVQVNATGVVFDQTIGATKAIRQLDILDGKTATLSASAAFDTTGITIGNASTLTIGNGANLTGANGAKIDGAVLNNGGTLAFAGNSQVGMNVGSVNSLTAINIGAGTVEFKGAAGGGLLKATNIKLTDATSAMKLSTVAQTVTGNIVNTSANNNSGSIIVDGANHSITGTIGAKDKSLAAINFTGNTQLTLTNPGAANAAATDLYVKDITTIPKAGGNGNGTLALDGNYNIYSTIGTANNPLNVVSILNTKHTDPTITTLKTGNSIDATTLQLTVVGGKNNTLALEADTTVNAAITTDTANNGVITLVKVGGNAGIVTINGNIGNTTNNKAINAINLAGNNIVFGGNTIFVDAGNINFAGGDILTLNDSVSPALQIKANIALAVAGNNGAIDANTLKDTQTLTISGTIGAADRSLNSLLVGQSKVILNAGDAYINTLDMGDNASVQLDHNTYKISQITGQGTINVAPGISANAASNTTLVEGTNLGSAAAPLKAIAFISGFDDTLTVGKNVNLYATNITTKTANNGSFEFNGGGTNIVSGQVGKATQMFNTVTLSNGTTAQYKNDAYFKGATTIGGGSTLQIGGNYTANRIVANGGGDTGTVEFTNNAPITVTLTKQAAAAANPLTALTVSGSGNVILNEIADPANAANVATSLNFALINFGNNAVNSRLVLPTGTSLTDVQIVSTAPNTVVNGVNTAPSVLVTGADSVIAAGQAIGDATHIVGIVLGSDNGITINNPNFYAGIDTVANGTGTVTLSGGTAAAPGKVYGLGRRATGNKLKVVNVTTNTQNFASTLANNLNIDDGVTFIAGNGTNPAIIDSAIQLGNNAGTGTLVITANTTLQPTASITAKVAGKGNVTFQGSAIVGNIAEQTASVALVNFTGTNGSVANLQGDIYSKAINFNGYNIVVLDEEVVLSGASSVNGQITLGTNKLTFTGGASTWGPNTSIHTTLANNTLGSIVISNGTVTAADNILTTVVIDDQDSLGATTQSYPLIKGGTNLTLANGKTVSLAETTFTSNQRFSAYSIIQDSNKDYLLQRQNIAAKVIAGDLASNSQYSNIPGLAPNVAAILNVNNTGDASKFLTNIGNLNSADTAQAIVALIAQDTNNLVVMQNIAEENISVLANRVHGVRYLQGPAGAPEGVLARPEGGVVGAADDAEDNVSYGGWAKAIYSDATQKSKGGVAGYSAKTTGGIFGFDTMANDNLMIGAAIGVTKTDMKGKNYKVGDKSTINGFSFSLYGAQQLVDNFFFQGATTFSTNQVKGKSKRYLANATGQKVEETASASYDNLTYAAEGMFGYDAKVMENVLLTPMAGIRYIKSSDESYKETGTTFQNKSVTSKFSDKTDVIVGARVIGDSMNLSQFMFYPEAHAFVTHKVSGKLAKIQSSLDGQVTPFIGQPDKSAKTSYNLGLSVTARPGPQMEYGIGYDANLASKYVAHTGTLKVRVNF